MRLQASLLRESSSYSIHFPQSTMSNSSSHSNSTLLQTPLPSTRTAGNQSTIHPTMQHRRPQMAHGPKPSAAARGSVKHLTCWYWSKGHCRFTEENCLYAHRNTGKVAKAPRQVTPGGPVLAGHSLSLALEASAHEAKPIVSEMRALERENDALRTENRALVATTERLQRALRNLTGRVQGSEEAMEIDGYAKWGDILKIKSDLANAREIAEEDLN
ncbi:hypothetical protein V8E54_001788 [Elaphomyces granulatus]